MLDQPIGSDKCRLLSGVPNLDILLFGGFPIGSSIVIGGTPGSGKSTMVQQICFHHATTENRVLYFQTLSEPAIKTLGYLKQMTFFEPDKMANESFQFFDLGSLASSKSLDEAAAMIMGEINRVSPSIVVIDSFKVFEDLASSDAEYRKFAYQVMVHLMALDCTSFILGEFSFNDLATNPLSSIVDGIIMMEAASASGEEQRFIHVKKMRGSNHDRNPHPFMISQNGITIYAPDLTIRRNVFSKREQAHDTRCKTGLHSLDALLNSGILPGSNLLISGLSGTGKSLLALELIYRGVKEHNEKGIYITFEDSVERIYLTAEQFGWDLIDLVNKDLLQIVCISQPEILIEQNLLMIQEIIAQKQFKRVAIDSLSSFLRKTHDAEIASAKTFQLTTLIQNSNALGFFTADDPSQKNAFGVLGVEATAMDGIILLTSELNLNKRERFLEIYKLRGTHHQMGRHKMTIDDHGVAVTAQNQVMV